MSSLETALIKLNWSEIDIRRRCQTTAFVMEALLLLLYAHMKTATGAVAVRLLMILPGGLAGMGLSLSVREMGREDAGIFGAITNSVSRADGFLTPILVTAIRGRAGGSWMPTFYWAALVQFMSLILYRRSVSIRSCRQLLAKRDENYRMLGVRARKKNQP